MRLRSNQLEDFKLDDGRVVIGRRKDCDIVLKSPNNEVSRQHAELEIKGQVCRVRDMESHNGTVVNGTKIPKGEWQVLNPGDRLYICDYAFEFVTADMDPSSATEVKLVPDVSEHRLPGSRSISLSTRGAISPQPEQLQALLVMAQALRDALNTDALLRKAVDILFDVFASAERVAIGFVDADGEFRLRAWRVRSGKSNDAVQKFSRSVLRQVIETGEAVFCPNAMEDFDGAESVLGLNICSVLCAPLMALEGKVMGLVHVDSSASDRFHESDLELLAAVTTQISLAVNYSRLHEAAVADALIRRDVENARKVQEEYLPTTPPSVEGYELCGFYRAARHIGGDYYDYIPLEDGRLAVVLGDVVGKGVPAALTMIRLATETRSSLEFCQSAAATLERLNRRLSTSFITLVVAILDPVNHTVTVSNAGHELPLLRRADGCVTDVGDDSKRCPLSVLEDEDYVDTVVALNPGDSLTLFSDGFPDAESASDTRYGKENLRKRLKTCCGNSREMVACVVEEVDHFIGDHPQFDDMCLLVIKRNETK